MTWVANLVLRALFPGFGGREGKAMEKRSGDDLDKWLKEENIGFGEMFLQFAIIWFMPYQ